MTDEQKLNEAAVLIKQVKAGTKIIHDAEKVIRETQKLIDDNKKQIDELIKVQ